MKTPTYLMILLSLAAGTASISNAAIAGDDLFIPKAVKKSTFDIKRSSNFAQKTKVFGESSEIAEMEDDLELNPRAINAADLSLVLPNGTRIEAKRVNRYGTSSGSTVWIGKHSNVQNSQASLGDEETILVVRNGQVTGTLRHAGKTYQIRADGSGKHMLAELAMAQFKDHDEASYAKVPSMKPSIFKSAPMLPNAPKVREFAEFDRGVKTPLDSTSNTSSNTTATQLRFAPAPGDIPVIRMLINYTAAAKTAAGDIDALIDLSVAETNQGYVNSGINARVEIAHKAQVTYTESNLDTDRARYTAKTDGYMDEIHTQRNTYAADVGMLFLNYGSSVGCGVASAIGAVESDAFAVVKYSCATGNFSFGHELGHLYGARHDVATDGTTTPFAYGHGYREPTNKWRTVMAYPITGINMPRLNYWSNPNVNYTDGLVMGTVATANNARVLNERAAVLAAFRGAPVDVNAAPVVNAGVDKTVRIPNAVTLTGSATDDGKPTGSSLTYAWTKVSGPGTVTVANAAAASTTASFSAAGVYVLRLTASDSLLSASDDVTVTATANVAPVANFTSTANAFVVQFTDASTDSDGSIASRAWNFGDGTSSTVTSPSKTYAAAGTYTVTLTVTDNEGLTNTKSATVTVSNVVGTNTILQQNTSGGARATITTTAAQSFKNGTTGTYKVASVSFYVSRDTTVPSQPLAISIGTSRNGGTVAGTAGSLAAATVTNTTAGTSYQKITLTFPTPVTLNAGTTYYLNFSTTATNARYYTDVSATSTYANGNFFLGTTSYTRDMRFEIIGQ